MLVEEAKRNLVGVKCLATTIEAEVSESSKQRLYFWDRNERRKLVGEAKRNLKLR